MIHPVKFLHYGLLLNVCLVGLLFSSSDRSPSVPLEKIRLPKGFTIDLYASKLPGARSMTWSPKGILYVGTRSQGKVYAVIDRDKDGKGDRVLVLLRGLDTPNGVAYHAGSLYVAEVSRLLRYDEIDQRVDNPPSPVVLRDDLPKERHHGWRYLRMGPDGYLYLSIGAPCNTCLRSDSRFGTIVRLRPDGSSLEIFARGVRNSVGFDWDPQTSELWFTDNGRDLLGDDIPPDELNHAPKIGLHFGFPYCHGKDIADPEFGDKRSCREFRAPAIALGPHVAALGIRFYSGSMFPPQYRERVFIAEHGSWNRSEPIGYRITTVEVHGDNAQNYQVFADGWLQDRHPWGRPVDLETLPDGSLLVSDDYAGVIYRIEYLNHP